MSNPTVVIKSGRLEGLTKKGIHIFKGIPYAKPPVGDLRWRPPQPIDKWTGTFKAHKFGAIAMQRQMEMADFVHNLVRGQGFSRVKQWAFLTVMKLLRLNESEDCLWLNVRTPNLKSGKKLPVMVFIHGGAHQDGGSHEPLYDGNALPQKDVVLVTINYRLGLFGFMAHPDLSAESEHGVSGNYGMLDQILALKWVQDNIGKFGGDPDNVTIFGESAGGESVLHLYCSPEAHGLFHKAIAQSPASGGQFSFLKKPFKWQKSSEEYGIDFAKRAGAAGPNQIKQLRQMSAEDLQKIVKEGYASAGNFYPVVDGHYLPKSTFETFQDGDHANVPLIIGNNDDEFSFFHSVLPMPLLEYAEVDQPTDRLPDYMTDEYGEDVERLKELYPGLETLDSVAVARFQGDYFFCAASRFYVGEMAHEDLDTTAPVYYYRFRRKSPLEGEVGGAFHAADLPFVFGALHSPVFASDEADNELAEIMQSYWTNFAKTGNPNGPSLPEWDTFSADGDPQWMILDRDTVGMQAIDLEENFEILTARIQRTIDTVRKEDSLLHTQSSVA